MQRAQQETDGVETPDLASQDTYSPLRGNLRLADILQIDSPFGRKQYLHTVQDRLRIEELIELIKESASLDLDQRLQSVQELLFSELAKIDAQTALQQVRQFRSFRWKSLVTPIFEAWSRSNFEAAMSQAAQLDGFLRNHAIEVALRTRSDVPKSERLIEAQRYGTDYVAKRVFSEERVSNLLHQPKQALESMLSDEVDNNVQLDELIEIVHSWIDQESLDALLPLYQTLHAQKLTHTPLQRRLLVEAIKHDPQTAWEHVLGLPPGLQSSVQNAIVSAWVMNDPNQALLAVAQVSNAVQRRELRNRILFAWPAARPVEALTELNSIDPEVRHLAIANAIRELARRGMYDEAVGHLQRLDGQQENTSSAKRYLAEAWSRENAAQALTWVLENTKETGPLRQELLKEVLAQLALSDPSKALRAALEQSMDTTKPTESGLEYWVFQSLASNGKFDEVLPMLNEVHGSQMSSKSRIVEIVGRNLIEFNRKDEAIALVKYLPESMWAEYFRQLTFLWLSDDPEHLIDNLQRIPNAASRTAVAQEILRHQEDREFVAADQLDHVRSFLRSEGVQ